MAPTFDDDISAASFSVASASLCNSKRSCLATKTKIRRRHSLTFGETNVIEIDRPDDLSHEDIWYSKEEYDIIKARNRVLVKMKKSGKLEESDEHSFRGLEHKLKGRCDERKSSKFDALNAVLEEQDRQYSRGLKDADHIARRYRETSSIAQEMALELGILDAEAAFEGEIIVDMDEYDDDDASIVSDLQTINSEDTQQKKTRLRYLFQGISHLKSKSHRRASM